MHTTRTLRATLLLSGLIAAGIGATILLDPAGFHAGHDIALGTDASLLSEVRAPGGALMALGLLTLAGAFARSLAPTAAAVGTTVYLSYGVSRLVALTLDGLPHPGLLVATAAELLLGLALALAWRHAVRRARHQVQALADRGALA